jgi:hypothetical protein
MSDIELPAPAFVIEVNDEPNMPVYTADQMRAAINRATPATRTRTRFRTASGLRWMPSVPVLPIRRRAHER